MRCAIFFKSVAVVLLLWVTACGENDRFGLAPVTGALYYDEGRPDPLKGELGKELFWDPLLSGNENIACATCHHPLHSTSDRLSLSVGEGGEGIGLERSLGNGASAVTARLGRNAPALFNVGTWATTSLMPDGSVELDPTAPGGFRTPAGNQLPEGLDNVLAAQAMFPVASELEMAGQPGENAQADFVEAGDYVGVWNHVADKVRLVPRYQELFAEVYGISEAEITYVHIANAIATYEAMFYRSDDSPFDQYLRGDDSALSADAKAGAALFYGQALCSTCHSGPFQTDHRYHSLAVPQIGPGMGDGPGGRDDYGRERITGRAKDRYRFRTPSLRNVEFTGPWGHTGAYNSLEAMIRHHIDPAGALESYDPTQVILPSRADLDALDFTLLEDAERRDDVLATVDMPSISLTDEQISQILAFLKSLSDDLRCTPSREITR